MKSKNKTRSKSPAIPTSLDDYKKFFDNFQTGYDPRTVLKEAKIEAEATMTKGKKREITPETNLYKALTIFEFDNGSLMLNSVPEMYRTFSVDFFRNLQKEFDCKTPSEKATAELVVTNFVRTLAIQFRITALSRKGDYSELSTKYLAILSKELDRANRHYLASLQALKMIKQPQFEVNIKTQTAIVGQNQVVQTKNEQFN